MVYFVGGSGFIASNFKTATIEDCFNYCWDKPVLGVDSETEGFFNFNNSMIMLQIGDEKNQFVIDTRVTDISMLKSVFESTRILKLFWNFKFDCKFLAKANLPTRNVFDGMLAEVIIRNGYKNNDYSLGHAVRKYCNRELDKSTRNQFIGLKGAPFTDKQIKYGAEDVEFLIEIYKKQTNSLKIKDLEVTAKIENRFVEVLSQIELNGFYLNSDKWKHLDGMNKENLIKARQVLDNYIIDNNHERFIDNQLDLFSTEKKVTVNWDSPKQTIEYLKFLGVDTTVTDKRTGLIKDTCEETHLKKYKSKFEFIGIYLTYKGLAKSVSTYGLEFLKHINPVTGRIHSNYWQIVTTGRMSSNDPNLQNIPAGEEYRSCFEGQGDNMLVVADYSAQEPRVTADKCQDPALIDFFFNGDGDIHSLVASKMYSVIEGKEVKVTKQNAPEKRQIGKVLNLKLDYGGSAYTVKDDLKVSEEEAQKFIDALEQAFPTKKSYFDSVIKDTFNNGYILIDNVTRRKVFIDGFENFKQMQKDAKNPRVIKNKSFWSTFYKFKGSVERASKNFPIQGTSGSMTKLAAILLTDKLEELNLVSHIKIVNMVHDEIVLEVSPVYINKACELISNCMELAGKTFCKTIPMIAEAIVCKYWKH